MGATHIKLFASIGFPLCSIFFLLFMFDIQISQANIGQFIGSYSGLSSSIWFILLCRNC